MRTVSTMIGGKRLGLAMAAFCLWASLGTAHASGVLWYNGDYDHVRGGQTFNAVGSMGQDGYVYQEFVVPAGTTWTIDQAYSNDDILIPGSSAPINVTSAYFEIRSGVSTGDGGTLIASGDAAATVTPISVTGHDYNVTVSVPNIMLSGGPSGTAYWLAVAPIVASNYESDVLPTKGANGTGVVIGGSYVAGSYYINNGGYDFEPASDITGISPVGYSMGVNGISMASVPEPSTLVMGVIGSLTMLGYAWRHGRRRA